MQAQNGRNAGSQEESFLLTLPREKAGEWAAADPLLSCSQSAAKGGPKRTQKEGPLGKGLNAITVAEPSNG